MSQMAEFKKEMRRIRKLRLSARAQLAVFAFGLLVTVILGIWGRLPLALPVINVVCILCLSVYVKGAHIRKAWLWNTMLFIAIVHVALLAYLPWTENWTPALVIAGVNTLDFCFIIWVLTAVERAVRPNAPRCELQP